MYGFRDASSGWMRDWQKLLGGGGYRVGEANPALFYNETNRGRGAVHGDDFYVLGSKGAIDDMAALLASKYSMRESHRLGFSEGCEQAATVLNRVVSLGRGDDGRKFVRIEPDHRHVELILQAVGLDDDKSKGVTTPSMKFSDEQWEKRRTSPLLKGQQVTAYRSAVMRGSFLAQDRADIGETIKTLAQGMASPRESHWEDLKRLGRYLLHAPCLALQFDQQEMPSYIRVSVDSDHAADRSTRKSTTGMVQRLGRHVIKATSNLQSSVALNVSEAEFYALVHGSSHGLGLQAFLRDLGLHLDLMIESDSSSARAFASRRGLGKQRHVQTRYMWIQERVSAKHFVIVKVATAKNVSDILTKAAAAGTISAHLKTMRLVSVRPHRLQKTVKVLPKQGT